MKPIKTSSILLILTFLLFGIISFGQEFNDSIKIVNKTAGYGYSYQDKKISFTAAGRILDDNEAAYPNYITAYNFRAASHVFLIAGGSIVVIGSIINIARLNENNQQANAFTGVIIGLPMMALSIPNYYIAKQNMKKAIEIYNNGIAKSASVKAKIQLGITANGAGVILQL